MNFQMYSIRIFDLENEVQLVEDDDDLDEHWQVELLFQDVCVCKNWRFWVQPFVPG